MRIARLSARLQTGFSTAAIPAAAVIAALSTLLGGCSVDTALTPPADIASVGSITPVAGYDASTAASTNRFAGQHVPPVSKAAAARFPAASSVPEAPAVTYEQTRAAALPQALDGREVAETSAPRSVSVLDSDRVVEGVTDEPVVAGIGTHEPRDLNDGPSGLSASAPHLPDSSLRPASGAPSAGTRVAFNGRPENPAADALPSGPMNQRGDAMPASEIACRHELHRLGVRYTELPRISHGPACGIAHPIRVSGLSGGIRIRPAATLNCPVTVEFAKWIKRDVAPAARVRYLSGIKSITQLSSYSCRTMNSQKGAPMSEHAHGNAIDIGSFKLDSGRKVDVRKAGLFAFRQRGFLNTVRADSCGYFNTVLGPGTNKYHWNHFHFDLRHRKSGRSYCE